MKIIKQEVQAVADLKAGYTLGHADVAILKELARIALASLEAEPVAPSDVTGPLAHAYKELTPTFMRNHIDVFERYGIYPDGSAGIQAMRIALDGMNRRAAMLQGADTELQRKAAIHDALCQKYNVESLTDFVDWQRNHIAELEAAPPAPVGPGETAVMPDYQGYTMTQRECFQAGKKAGLAEAVTTAYKLRDAVETIRNSGIAIDAEKILAERDALNAPDCWCRTCRPITLTDMRFVVCPECGNKRCPHANDHRHACTGSNEPGQEGSAYPAAPRQEV